MESIDLFFTLDNFNLNKKRILVRVDMNSPIDPQTMDIIDDSKIRAYVSTFKELVESDAKIVVVTHQGRPGDYDFTETNLHAKKLESLLNHPVTFVDGLFDSYTVRKIKQMKPSDILLLQNVRFYSEETIEKPPEDQARTHLVRKLSPLFDYFLLDAVGAMHRSHASLVGFPEILPTAAGRLMEKEVTTLSKLKASALRPYIFILGGGKLKDAINYVELLLKNNVADKIILTGLVANMFLVAMGLNLGASNKILEKKKANIFYSRIRDILSIYDEKIVLPTDFAALKNDERIELTIEELPSEYMLFDIGNESLDNIKEILSEAGLVVMRGPAGYIEDPRFRKGTEEIIRHLSRINAVTICGGGHLGVIASELGIRDKISHISTAGGAMISFFANKPLPVLEELKRATLRELI
ncbi:MAG: phosphoglycerate kinase [Candidatus Odinarchaeota archaeon]|nr:phosphoglycerate kinase [Candidatus Odinarchaeota archaeon]